jgi:gliding motility-associated lipoprotein GldH
MNPRYSWLFVMLFILFSCTNLVDYSEQKAIKGASWLVNDVCRFEYLVKDTITPKDIFINLRHTGMYKYSNIYFFVTTLAPNGMSIKDTVEFTLADKRGKWAGAGIGDICDVELAYKRNVRFGQSGRYILYIQHGMRDQKLEEITDIGISINNYRGN